MFKGFFVISFVLFGSIMASAQEKQLPYEIHAILPMTGYISFLGRTEHDTMELVEKTVNEQGGINGQPVRFIYHDDETKPQNAVALASQILASHPAVMIGPSTSASCGAIAPLLASGPVTYCLSPGIHPPADSFMFTASVSTYDTAEAVVRYFRLRGWTRLAMLTSTDASGQDAERGLLATLKKPENKDVTVLERLNFNTSDINVTAQIERIRAASPQALIAWSTGAPIATVFRGLRQAGIDIPVATTDGNMTQAQMAQYADFLPKQLYFGSPEWMVGADRDVGLPPAVVAQQMLFEKTLAASGRKMEAPAELGWEGPLLLVNALRKLSARATAEQLRAYLVHVGDYPGIDGTYDFVTTPQRGLDGSNVVVTRWNAAAQRWDVVSKPAGIPIAEMP